MTAGTMQWWGSLRHGGLLIAPQRLGLVRQNPPDPITPRVAERLRADLVRLGTGKPDVQREFLDTVLEQVCDLRDQDGARWLKGNDVPAAWSRRGASGEVLKPRRLWLGAHGAALPVFVDHESRLGVGRGRRTVSRAIEWLRASSVNVALVTNHEQFRLVYAGPDYDAWAEWDTSLWFEEGAPSAQVKALRWLVAPESLVPPSEGKRSGLLDAIEESRKGQSELSASLGERVRQAVEQLIQTYGERLAGLPADVSTRDIYVAATRVVMRMVVILFAEARELLPRDNPRYEASYGLQALRASLDRVTGSSRQRRQFHDGAWPRILGLFRLVYEGSHHPELLIRRYGGGLFAPGAPDAGDAIGRALDVFEDPEHGPNDDTVARILDLLGRTEMRVRIGHGFRNVSAPVDFSDLSSEYIGILYEGLLDYELRRAEADSPLVFLDLGDQPVLPLARLEAMSDAEIKGLVEKVKVSRKAAVAAEGEADEDDEDGEASGDEAQDADDEGGQSHPANMADVEDDDVVEVGGEPDAVFATADVLPVDDADEPEADQSFVYNVRAHDWAVRAVKAGGLVPKPRSRRPDAVAAFDARVATVARQLVTRVVQPGEWFLVLWGGTRKGSGTFYTRPQLAVPTVHRTLRPLAYDPPAAGESAPISEWLPKPPDAILALKVCDPAAGSGSFVVAALRFLTDALWHSLLYSRWILEDADRFVVAASGKEPPPWFAESVRDLPVTAGDAEAHIRARLRRVVVERCVYGVDLDPLAVELARLSLWVETMNRDLPFEFVDHRLKVGNALVGCWFDRFRDYPAMAWMREGGDTAHDNFVHHFRTHVATSGKKKGQEQRKGDVWTAAIKQWRDDHVKPALVNWIIGQGSLLQEIDGRAPEVLHDGAVDLLRRMEALPLHEPEERARFYRDEVQSHAAFRRLAQAFDTWCALWFWPADDLASAPMPADFAQPPASTLAVVQQLSQAHRFFHWELEFADVFAARGSGFDAIVGNPPWEIQKPNSKEFFSNIDPLYRTYGKQDAIRRQGDYFRADAANERQWVAYGARFKALANWNKHAATPFGDPDDGGEAWTLERGRSTVQSRWRQKRGGRAGYADGRHPFQHQGSADINTYKMFLEQAHALLKEGGRLGMLVPAGIYSDKGSASLRGLFLDHNRWELLYAFQNERFVFANVHHAFKIAVLFIVKAGGTQSVLTKFRLGPGDSPEAAELPNDILQSTGFLPVETQTLARLSPTNRAVLEIRNSRDLEILEKIYANSVLLGDTGPDGWGIRYSTEFHMTNDSKLFPPRPQWEAKGYQPDEYGRWIKFRESQLVERQPAEIGWIRLADGSAVIHEDAIEDIALPLYQGVMIHQLDFAAKGWVSGTGQQAEWRNLNAPRRLEPQMLMAADDFRRYVGSVSSNGVKVAFRDITNSTNERTVIGALVPDFPCGNVLGVLRTIPDRSLALGAALCSFTVDWITRNRLVGTHLNLFVLEDLALPRPNELRHIDGLVARLAFPSVIFASTWCRLKEPLGGGRHRWMQMWAATAFERLRLRCQIDAVVAASFGLDANDLAWILKGCDHPVEVAIDKRATRKLDPKGFWRTDKHVAPELRQSVLTVVAFSQLQGMIEDCNGDRSAGIASFCGQNEGEGWMPPESLRLADYGLGHDERAKAPQPVASRLGDRFYSWQLEQSADESWAECERHARNILGPEGFARLKAELEPKTGGYAPPRSRPSIAAERPASSATAQKRLFPGRPSLFDDGTEDPV